MVSTEKRVDLLLVTALPEERFLLDKWMYEKCGPVENGAGRWGLLYGCLPVNGRKCQIAVGCLNGMCNLWALEESVSLIESILPKCILLVGLAGGKVDYLHRGDVGFSKRVVYTSYVKFFSQAFGGESRSPRF